MPPTRQILPVTLDDETYAALRRLCDELDVPATALVEAFARAVTRNPESGWARRLIARARRIKQERSSRR